MACEIPDCIVFGTMAKLPMGMMRLVDRGRIGLARRA